MEDSLRWLGRITLFWMGWLITTVAVLLAAFAIPNPPIHPYSSRGVGIIALLFLAGGYGALKLIRIAWIEMDQRPSEE